MIKCEGENEIISTDGYFTRMKPPSFIQKNGINQANLRFATPDKLKDFIEIKVKVVSTQLTQNGKLIIFKQNNA